MNYKLEDLLFWEILLGCGVVLGYGTREWWDPLGWCHMLVCILLDDDKYDSCTIIHVCILDIITRIRVCFFVLYSYS